MKLKNQNPIKRDTSSNGDYQLSTIPADEIGTVAMLLSQIYSKPKHAVIRELISNGVDAMVAAGSTKPITLALPSADNLSKRTITQPYRINCFN